jgi:dipeptidyl aminopeptidase/acylaminoacyl peptidase
LSGGAFTPDLYQCIVSLNGIADLPLMMKQEKSDHGKHHWVLSYWKKAIGGGEMDFTLMAEVSPARFPQNFKAPVLLVHGSNDTVVSIDQSAHMNKVLGKANKKVEFKKLKSGDHHLSNRETRIEALKVVIDFVDRYIGKSDK